MRVWDIAKALITYCSTPEDVEQVLTVMADESAMQDLRSMLSEFSLTTRMALQPTYTSGTTKKRDRESLAIAEMERLFRDRGMRNKDVESWLRERLKVQVAVGKKSLGHYLRRVVRALGPNGSNRIMRIARQESSKRDKRAIPLMLVASEKPQADSKASVIDQLESLFRAQGMTNPQVEQWASARLGNDATIGRGSLRGFLRKLLDHGDSNWADDLLTETRRRLEEESTGRSDLRNYWDHLDKRLARPD